jgi:hypothetical protein
MARQTRAHRKFRYLHIAVHRCDVAMAACAWNSLVHMHAVVEVRIVRHAVHAFPWNRDSLFVIFCKLDNFGGIFPCNGVTIHTGRNRWNGCVGRRRGCRMTILTIDLHCAGMKFMRKRNGLNRIITNATALGTRRKICYRKRSCNDKQNNRHSNTKRIIKQRPFYTHNALALLQMTLIKNPIKKKIQNVFDVVYTKINHKSIMNHHRNGALLLYAHRIPMTVIRTLFGIKRFQIEALFLRFAEGEKNP